MNEVHFNFQSSFFFFFFFGAGGRDGEVEEGSQINTRTLCPGGRGKEEGSGHD